MGNACCSTETGCCETSEPKISECCPTQNANVCPSEFVADMWKKAFREALFQAKVDVLKEKIRKSWAQKLDKGADLTLETMESQWSAVIAKAKAEGEFKEKLKQAAQEGKK